MGRFPFARQVGDLLASGINIEVEQEELLDAPGGRPMVAVWSVPDPMLESDQAFWQNGRPVLLPVVLENCVPEENVFDFIGVPISLLTALTADDVPDYLREDILKDPKVIAEIPQDDYTAWLHGDYEVLPDHHSRHLFDVWPIEPSSIQVYQEAALKALQNAHYGELLDYCDWINGNTEPDSIEEEQHVLAIVESGGLPRPSDEFDFTLHLPSDDRFTWERLVDLSQQGWTSMGLTGPQEERKRLLRSRDTPWASHT